MVEKVEYFCDICGKDITHVDHYTCKICGREHCNICHTTVKGRKDMWLSICSICKPMYFNVKDQMNIDYKKHDDLHKEYCDKLYENWKKESLLLDVVGKMCC